MDWYLSVLKKYAVFTGRAQRAEYWYFILFNVLAMIALIIVDSITGSFSGCDARMSCTACSRQKAS